MILGSWTLNNTRLLLLSGIGEPYDPATGKGVVGRNLTHQISFSAAQAFFDKPLNRFMGAAPAGMRMSDFDGDSFDHSNLPFIRGGTFAGIGTGFQPIVGFGTVPSVGEGALGRGVEEGGGLLVRPRGRRSAFAGEHIAYKDHYMDLDPTLQGSSRRSVAANDASIGRTTNARWSSSPSPRASNSPARWARRRLSRRPAYGHYDTRRYQSTHVQGGTIMGKSPEHSVVNHLRASTGRRRICL